jgi:hypothetical protein
LIVGGAVDVRQAHVLDGDGETESVKVAQRAEMFQLPLATGGGWDLPNGHLIGGVANGWLTEFPLRRERIYAVIYLQPPVAR